MAFPEFQSLTPPTPLVLRGVDWYINRRAAKRLKLEIQINDPSYWSRLGILNSGRRPITLHATDWCIGRGQNRRSFGSVSWDQEILPHSTLDMKFMPYGIFRENVWRYSGGKDIHTLRFRAHTSSGMMQNFRPSKELIDCLTKSHEGTLPQC